MRNLQEIAEKKLQSSLQRKLIAMDADIQAMYRRQAAEGSLKSGNTFINVIKLVTDSYKELCNQASLHHKWVLNESLIVNDELVENLVRQTRFYGGQLQKASAERLGKAAEIVAHRSLYERYMPEVTQANNNTLEEFKANLEGEAAAKINRGIKGAVVRLVGWGISLVKGA